METIRDLFSKDIDQHIEEVIKVDQANEETVRGEIADYIVTDSIKDHFLSVYKAVADGRSEPHEGIGIWVSGFFGSGKSSFAKILGYTVAAKRLGDTSASDLFKHSANDQTISDFLDQINTAIPYQAVIFDVSMDRGVRTASERITEIMYKALLRELDYSDDFDLAHLEIGLEADGLLDEFQTRFKKLHKKPWKIRRKLGRAINEASHVLHELQPKTYPNADSWARSIGQGRADITPNLLAERAFELVKRRRLGHSLIFIIDEVGQYVSRSVDKMLDLQAVVQAFGRESKNRVTRREAVAPAWIIVTSQEKLNEVVDALDSRKVDLARLQDRFPLVIDLKQSDIAEITSKRVLAKSAEAQRLLGQMYDDHEGRLKTFGALEKSGRNTGISRDHFINLYPYLPYQIDLCIDIVSGLRLRRGTQRHIGGSNRTIILQAQQMLVHQRTNLAAAPVGHLVTLDRVYELLYAGNLLPTEVTREVDDVPNRLPGNEPAYKVAKAIALLEAVTDAPRTPHNLAVVLHPRVDADSELGAVETALDALEEKQVVKQSEEGYKLLTLQEKKWEDERRGLAPKPAERNRIKREILAEVFADPNIRKYRYQNLKAIKPALIVEGEVVDSSGDVPLNILMADDKDELAERSKEARTASNEKRNDLFWVFPLSEEIHRLIEELYRSREMVSTYDRIASQQQLAPELRPTLSDEKVQRDRHQRALRSKLAEAVQGGSGFFQAVHMDSSSLGHTLPEIVHGLLDSAVPSLYPKIELGNRPIKGDEVEKFLTAANLSGLPPVFFDQEGGLGLVAKQAGKFVPNLGAEICREVLDYLKREHSYGNKVTGKIIDAHFQGIGYGWDPEVLKLVLAVMLRGGAIEVTHQGRRYRNHTDPTCRVPFTNKPAFRAASFAPRESFDLKLLADAARSYEAITGNEVDIEESALAQAFQKLASEDRERILLLVATMRARRLPGTDRIGEHLKTIEGVLEMAAKDCVVTLAHEGKSYQDARSRATRLSEVLTPQNLESFELARRVLAEQWPVLESEGQGEQVVTPANELRQHVESEDFFQNLEAIRLASEAIQNSYGKFYAELFDKRRQTYERAVNEIKGLPEWSQVYPDPKESKVEQDALLAPLASKITQVEPDLSGGAAVCRETGATIAEMKSDLDALEAIRGRVVQQLQELAAPERKVEVIRLKGVRGRVLENTDDLEAVLAELDQAVDELKQYLLKRLAEGYRIVLE